MNYLPVKLLSAFVAIFIACSAFAGPDVTTYQAKIIKPDGLPLEASSVNFKFTILNPAGTCILYSETYSSINMASTGGLISFPLGSGVKVYPVSATTFAEVFSNVTPNLSCDAGGPGTFTPRASDTRKVVMQFHDGSGWQTLPAMNINAVPYAMYANEAQKISGLPTCNPGEALSYNGVTFSCEVIGGGGAVTSSTVSTALGYTPASSATVDSLVSSVASDSANLASVSATVYSVSTTVTSLQNSVAASFAAMASSQWVSLNGLTSASQTIAFGTAGVAPNVSSVGSVHTFSFPFASVGTTTAGLISNSDYTVFMNKLNATGSAIISALGYTPADAVSFTTLSSNMATVSAAVSSLSASTAASFSAITNSQWLSSGTAISYSTGDVGVGTSAPERKLHVYENSSGGAPVVALFEHVVSASGSQTGQGSPVNILRSSEGDMQNGFGPRMSFSIKDNVNVINAIGSLGYVRDGADNSGKFLLNVVNSGTTVNVLSATKEGNVGIGTATPVAKLEVSGGVKISMESAACAVSFAGTLRYNSGSVEFCNGTTWSALGVSGAGLQSFNGSTSGTQTFANGTTGTAPTFVTANGVHTLNIPYASAGSVTAGLISNSDYLDFANKITSSAASIAQVLGYVPASGSALGNYLARSNNLSDLTSSATARANLGLGGFATVSSLDLGSASATGILDEARLPSFANVASGSQYTKVTVDGKGRVTSGAQLALSDVTTALGYTPASASASSQWITSGTSINYVAGNVGIGTSSPTYRLEIAGTSSVADRTIAINETPVVYLPNQADPAAYYGSIAVGDGLRLLSGSGGNAGQFNTAVGIGAGVSNTTGAAQTAIGFKALANNTTGTANTALGGLALTANTTGTFNIAIGYTGLADNISGGSNIAIGSQALLYNTTGNNNVGVGTSALMYNLGKRESTAIGHNAMGYANNTASATISYNTAVGAFALFGSAVPANNTGTSNTALGHSALKIITSGSGNTGVGYNAGSAITTGNYNVVLGSNTGSSIATSSNNILLADGQGNERVRINGSGNVGIGTIAPTARLQISAGTSQTAPFKFTSGTLLSAAQSGTIEYDGTALYFTDSTNTRRTLASTGAPGYYESVNTIANSSGNIALYPNTGAGSVIVSATTASTNSTTGALIVKGGLGVAGNIFSSGTIITSSNIQGTSITATNGMITPYVYGSIVSGGSLRLESTTHVSKGNILLAPNGGNVGIGLINPIDKLHIYDGDIRLGSSTDTNSTQGMLKFGSAGSPNGYAGIAGIAKGSPDRMELAFSTAYGPAVEAMRISEYGSVGIGTSSPLSILTVNGSRQSASIKNTISTFDTQAFNIDVGAGIGMGGKINVSGTMAHFGLVGARKENNTADNIAGYLVFETRPAAANLSEKMRITSLGNLGLGTTTPGTLMDLYAATSPTLRIRSASNDPASGPTIRLVEDLSENGGLIRYNALTNNLDLGVSESGADSTRISINRTTGNVGVGTTNPKGPLHVKSSNAAYESGSLVLENSTGSSVYSIINSANQLFLGYNSDTAGGYPQASYQTRMYIDPTGNVGIGTTAPSSKLEVVVSNSATTPGSGNAIKITNADSTVNNMAGLIFNASVAGSSGAGMYAAFEEQDASPAANLRFYTNSGSAFTERIRISTEGNTGIGTSAPNTLLQVGPTGPVGIGYSTFAGSYLSTSGQAQYIGNWASTGYWGIGPATNAIDHTLRIGRIDTASATWSPTQVTNLLIGGNLGIGQNSPTNALDILRTTGDLGVRLKADSGDSDVTIHLQNDVQTWKMINKAGFSDAFVIEDTTGGKTPFAIKKANGFIGIGGVTSPAYQLEVSGTVQITSGSALRIGAANICTSAGCVSSSDLRLKENIQPLDFSLEKLLSLNGVQYDWKNKAVYGDQHQIGFIAQELEKVFPEVVYTDKETGLKTVSYGQLLAPVVEAIKVLFGKTQDNTRAIASLEEKDSVKDQQIKALTLENERKDKELREMKERLDRLEKALAR